MDEEEYNVGITHAATYAHWLVVSLWQMDPMKMAASRAYDWRLATRRWDPSMVTMVKQRWPFVHLYCKLLTES